MISLKSEKEIKLLQKGGKILAQVLETVKRKARPGVSTRELNELAEELILTAGGAPSFKGYGDRSNPFPAALCTSVNDEVVHGIPGRYVLKNGDILSLDIGMRYPSKNGLYTDMAFTMPIGKVNKRTKKLIKVTKKALDLWIKNLKPGKKLNDIAKIIQIYIEGNGFSIVRDLVGHGVGHAIHEDPQIPNYFIPGFNVELKEGMVLAFEPMVCEGDYRIKTRKDGWTIVTLDGSLCAHFEHTVAVTKRGGKVLTK
ncbi:type I methionyl aminopeptidase [Patescibacteria group bacterium]|nr:type I methionyl aminopeptidase [Patescibacteria group bacterium]